MLRKRAVGVVTTYRSPPGTPRAVVLALAGAAGLFLAWRAADALLLVFTGLLLAALLDACARVLGKLLPIGRAWNVAIVSLAIALALVGLLVWSGFSIADQIHALLDTLDVQLKELERGIGHVIVSPSSDGASPARRVAHFLFPDPHRMFGEARSAFVLALGGIGETVVVVLIGVFVAFNPAAYRRAVVELLPARRQERTALVLDEVAHFLRRWLAGQLAAILVLAVLTWIMLLAMGVADAPLLGIQAGLLNFIPYLGAVVGAVPILLVALPLGTTTALIVLGLFTVIHVGVGYVVVPLIQKRAVHLPPALTLASLILFGVLFGVASVAVATPLVAALRHAFLRLRESDPGGQPEF